MDRVNIDILEEDLEFAQNVCASIYETDKRNRAVANVIAAQIGAEYFNSDIYSVDSKTGLHNVPMIVKDYDISDIYVNDSYIDVRIYFSKEEMSVPIKHFDVGILPKLYMFINLSSDIKHATVAGFLRPEKVNKSGSNDDVYFVNEDLLESFYEVESCLTNDSEAYVSDSDNAEIYEYLEGSLDEDAIYKLFNSLVHSKIMREKLLGAIKANSIFNFISIPDKQSNGISNSTSTILESSDDYINNENNNESMYSTEVTPSGADVINSLDSDTIMIASEDDVADINDLLDDISGIETEGKIDTESNSLNENEQAQESIDALFPENQNARPVPKKKSGLFVFVLCLILMISAGGYWYYTNIMNKNLPDNDNLIAKQETSPNEEVDSEIEVTDVSGVEQPMPDETINSESIENEAIQAQQVIPNIEQNLNTSVLVSNLKVDWEVPEGYVTNTSAKRYLVKLGKVVQLNLKSELLLLNKPPLVNKITVELSFDPKKEKFAVVGIKDSSGEKSVDALIIQTVSNAVALNLSINSGIFSKLQGNPILVIHL